MVESLNTEHVIPEDNGQNEVYLVCQQDLRKKSLEAALLNEVAVASIPSLSTDKKFVGALD